MKEIFAIGVLLFTLIMTAIVVVNVYKYEKEIEGRTIGEKIQ